MLTLEQVRRAVPAPGGQVPTYKTVYRWVTEGVRVRGWVVRLRAERAGGRWAVDPAAVAEFVRELTGAALGGVAPPEGKAAADARVRAEAEWVAEVLAGI